MDKKYIFKSYGNYLGFIDNDNIFDRDGVYLGWLDDGILFWHSSGKFGGVLKELNGNLYLLKNQLQIPPIPKIPKTQPDRPIPLDPPINIMPIVLPIGNIDIFK